MSVVSLLYLAKRGRRVRELIPNIGLAPTVILHELFLNQSRLTKSQERLFYSQSCKRNFSHVVNPSGLHVLSSSTKTSTQRACAHYPRKN